MKIYKKICHVEIDAYVFYQRNSFKNSVEFIKKITHYIMFNVKVREEKEYTIETMIVDAN